MSLPKITHVAADAASHLLYLLPRARTLPAELAEGKRWQAALKRRDMKVEELAKSPLALDLADGRRAVCAMIDPKASRFERLTLLRKAVMALLDEAPKTLAIVPLGIDEASLNDAIYVALLNGVALPARKKKPAKPLQAVGIAGRRAASAEFSAPMHLASANTLARELTALPPNELPPAAYRKRVRALAKAQGWKVEEYDFKRLKKMGAGAFCAVAQGSNHQDAAIVHLAHRPKGAQARIALVGKGICFDTGGHNLKPAKYMAGMHEDMNGSAVALALTQAIADLKLPVAVDCWLAIAENHLSPEAYIQGDIVTALDGTTIEIVHTDAEGRLVLADTLALASKAKPDLIVDFATLTGSMHYALGSRYSGIFASEDKLGALAVAAGVAAGERVCAFPLDADYEPALDSKVADIKQCTLDGEADHILAARFLKRFTKDLPWLHMDLSASSCSGGLGATASDLTGFGVAWGATFVESWLRQKP
ncbi:MAG: leucyl aminopeptidase family protein [Gammaproteobacteria bacterium]|nr:leucyl aminopeptidase family protein [Gammaproteobacteria bacterium]MBU1645860.1 leucyl aminopeptidase family protein [Gammaproteobacteria bacterium]MBU1971922.1 leucyl aminopeptidase family protein [Gammaproteobacteria bacterium]